MLYIYRKSYNLCLYPFVKSNGFHSSSMLNGSRQTGNAMRKVLGTSRKKKFHFSEVPKMPTPDVLSKGSFEGKHSGNSRRSSVLNKLFMKHITDQMSTGECSYMILGYGIEVNRVQVTPDYKIVRVYWTAKCPDDAEIVLNRCSGILRHELSQLRVMGTVPIIQFVKDKHYEIIVELDNKIAIADFGEDYIPQMNLTDKYKSQLEISAPLDNYVKERLKELDRQESDIIEDLPLPLMPQNVLGIPHSEILDRIMKSIKKRKALHRSRDANIMQENRATVDTLNDDPVCLGDPKSQRAAFREFLHKRQLLRLKAKYESCHVDSELDCLEEINENHVNQLNILNLTENEDFIVEDIDEKS